MKTIVKVMLLASLWAPAAVAQVPYDRLVKAESEPANWLTYAGSYKSQRYTQLDQINKQNVTQLKPAWVYQLRTGGVFETSPVVVDGVMYMTEPPSTVTAIDVRSGRPLWSWTPKIPDDVIVIGSPPVNRGVAVLDNMVYAGSIAGHLAALDAKSGALRWDVAVDDNKIGYYLTLAPLAIDGKIIVGVSGAENGIRGFVDAYDAKTGKRVWRRHTIPAPGEPGNETWGGKDSWKTGGGSTWLTGSYDPELKLLYWQVGNPGPDWNGDFRQGDNLYTCSVLAINPDDGSLKWTFQFTPHDTHDWDANETVVLFDATVNGRPRKLLTQANRNGFYYVLDRATGEFIAGTPFVKQTWAEGLDAKGRPVTKPGLDPNPEGILVYPSIQGAANWHAPSYSPKTGLFYQTAVEMGTIYYKGEAVYKPGIGFTAGGGRTINGDDAWSAVRALDATTGKLKWEFKLLSAGRSSLLSTAGGLVFGGTEEGNFFALDADTGKPLWDTQLGANIRGIPMSFGVDGKQYVAIAAGFALFAERVAVGEEDDSMTALLLILGGLLVAQTPAPAASAGAVSLNYEFFKTNVQPVFLKKRPGNARCLVCHRSGGVTYLQPLSPGATTWDEEQSRKNFEAVKRLVVPGAPLKSKLLMHPLAEPAGGDEFHGGGHHWKSQDDPEWQTLAAWVRGQTASTK